ncbi:hypothetical protein SO802_033666 [Lithocarpus litseifolius]|uniref:Reverse transcriptase domain-containing protein n=1 Tax=Lithocarpus litseifolius TaxID=425828 RepID=A0AAW2BDW3_9ROSI
MNLIIWNYRGTLNSTFCNNVIELTQFHNLAILILIETKASGDRAKRIADRLPFDGAIFTNTIGLSGGLWLLWDSSRPIWLTYLDFLRVVREAWAGPTRLAVAVSTFVDKARIWNKNIFGDLFHRKKRVLARLRGIQAAMSVNPNNFLVDLERDLTAEYHEVTRQEEEFWAMKSRITWLVEGDRNTSFYHTLALVCIRRNRILCMKDSVVSNDDIAAGLWSLKAFKAPGFNGLHAGIFQRFWLLVRDIVREELKGIFALGRIPDYLNQTIITLIPKCQNPETFNHYRPISLCNTVYKIVTKIIVARLRPLLPGLVSPLQTAFVPGRKGFDNAIIVQEIIHSMSRKRGSGGSMATKIDLEKAYDRLEWSLIRDTLTLFKIPN